MAEVNRLSNQGQDDNLGLAPGLEGFDQFFDGEVAGAATTLGDEFSQRKMEKLIDRVSELISLSVDQRIEYSKTNNQLIENQRQLIATQQILIKLMERSIELTRHVTSIEERLPGVFELPRIVESLRQRVAQLEGIEIR